MQCIIVNCFILLCLYLCIFRYKDNFALQSTYFVYLLSYRLLEATESFACNYEQPKSIEHLVLVSLSLPPLIQSFSAQNGPNCFVSLAF
jgi:hypothetical protein